MSIKVRVIVDRDSEEEVVITCKEVTSEILRLQQLAAGGGGEEMLFKLDGREYFVPLRDVLFFATYDENVCAHTAQRMYYSDKKLFELSALLPNYFMRVSKSCIVNIRKISSLHREVTGVCEVHFAGSEKLIYISRMYYKPFRERLSELRLGGGNGG